MFLSQGSVSGSKTFNKAFTKSSTNAPPPHLINGYKKMGRCSFGEGLRWLHGLQVERKYACGRCRQYPEIDAYCVHRQTRVSKIIKPAATHEATVATNPPQEDTSSGLGQEDAKLNREKHIAALARQMREEQLLDHLQHSDIIQLHHQIRAIAHGNSGMQGLHFARGGV